jgi:hypothetical protein
MLNLRQFGQDENMLESILEAIGLEYKENIFEDRFGLAVPQFTAFDGQNYSFLIDRRGDIYLYNLETKRILTTDEQPMRKRWDQGNYIPLFYAEEDRLFLNDFGPKESFIQPLQEKMRDVDFRHVLGRVAFGLYHAVYSASMGSLIYHYLNKNFDMSIMGLGNYDVMWGVTAILALATAAVLTYKEQEKKLERGLTYAWCAVNTIAATYVTTAVLSMGHFP